MPAANQHPALLLFSPFQTNPGAPGPAGWHTVSQHPPSLSLPKAPFHFFFPLLGPREALIGRRRKLSQIEFGGPSDAHINMTLTAHGTFVQNRAKNCQAVADSGAVPAPASELVLALLDASLDTLGHAGHDLHVIPAEAQLLGHQAWDAGAEDGLSAQGGVLGSHSQGPAGKTRRRVRPSPGTDRLSSVCTILGGCCFCHEGHLETGCCSPCTQNVDQMSDCHDLLCARTSPTFLL